MAANPDGSDRAVVEYFLPACNDLEVFVVENLFDGFPGAVLRLYQQERDGSGHFTGRGKTLLRAIQLQDMAATGFCPAPGFIKNFVVTPADAGTPARFPGGVQRRPEAEQVTAVGFCRVDEQLVKHVFNGYHMVAVEQPAQRGNLIGQAAKRLFFPRAAQPFPKPAAALLFRVEFSVLRCLLQGRKHAPEQMSDGVFSHTCTFLLQGGPVSVLSARQPELTAQTADTRPEA